VPILTSKAGSNLIFQWLVRNVMAIIPICECSNRTMGKNAEFVFVPSQFSSGREIEASIRELVSVMVVVKTRISARFAHWI
jgi:hypothetical protein